MRGIVCRHLAEGRWRLACRTIAALATPPAPAAATAAAALAMLVRTDFDGRRYGIVGGSNQRFRGVLWDCLVRLTPGRFAGCALRRLLGLRFARHPAALGTLAILASFAA